MQTPGITELAARAVSLVPPGGRAILGIAGPPGAGKSTLVEQLLATVAQHRAAEWLAHVPMDGFHLADVQLARLGLLDRKGAPETFDAAGYATCLQRIHDDRSADVYVPGFERDLEQPIAAALVVTPEARLIITEGNYLLLDSGAWTRARTTMAEVWYVELDDDVRRARLIARHVEFGKSVADATAWVDRSDEANAQIVKGTRPAADQIVPYA